MSVERPPDYRGRTPLLTASIVRRIRARCVGRARRYGKHHPDFSPREQMYYFFGALAVLETIPDPAARALAKEFFAAAWAALKVKSEVAK